MRIAWNSRKGLCAFGLVLFLVAAPGLFAAPAAPVEVTLSQPGGRTFVAVPRGDEYGNWLETKSGHSIAQLGGRWYYAIRDGQGRLQPGPYAVGSLDDTALEALPRHVAPDREPPEQRILRRISRSSAAARVGSEAALISHSQNVLVILVDYTDILFTSSDATFQSAMFGATDSVKEFFLENSYGGFTIGPAAETCGISNDGIVHVARAVTHPDPGGTTSISRAEAAAIVPLTDACVDYSAFDTDADDAISADELSIVMILAGYENSYGNPPSPRVWGHASAFSAVELDGKTLSPYTMFGEIHSSHPATIGIMAHELGHLMLGLPDLYDTDSSSAGIGDWGLMGGGSWNYTGTYLGDSPAHLSAWSKVTTQLTSVTEISGNPAGVTFAEASANEDAKKLWIDNYRVGEYFLLENRQQSGYDAGLPGNGLIIWHIDEHRLGNSDESHKLVDVEEADGNDDLDVPNNQGDANDPFYSGNNSAFTDATMPNSRNYAGEVTNLSVTNISASSATMTADLSVPDPSGDHVRYDEDGNTIVFGLNLSNTWLGINLQNDTGLDRLDGVDFLVVDSSLTTVDVLYYGSMSGGEPSGLIASETGVAVSRGWNRILFSAPQDFPDAAERGIVVKVNGTTGKFPFVLDSTGADSARSYFSTTGAGAFIPMCAVVCGDLNLIALFSSAADAPPEATSITPDTTGPTNAGSVDFTVGFSEDVVNFNDAADVVVAHSGTAHSGISISGSGSSYTVSVTGITGNGSFTLAVDTTSDVEDGAGQGLDSSVTSASVAIDNEPPGIQIGAPSLGETNGGPVSYTVSYTGADTVTLANGDVSLNTTGDASGSVNVSGSGTVSRTVTVSGITGSGTIGISVAADSASDTAGNGAAAAGPSTTFVVDNSSPTADSVVPTTTGPTNAGSVDFDITFSEDVANFDQSSDLVITHSGTAHSGVSITGAGLSYTAQVTGISGTGSFTVAVDTGSDVTDTVGNPLSGSAVSAAVSIDNDPPTLVIGSPSVGSTTSGPVSFVVDYSGADAVTLEAGDVSLNATGTANAATIEVTGSGTAQRTVTLSDISGAGTLGISIAAGTASDTPGNLAGSSGPSSTFIVELGDLIYADGFEGE